MAAHAGDATPRRRAFAGTLAQSLRYGENPHQSAAFYLDGSARPGVATATQLQGKELSYNNINDTDAAFECVSEFDPAEGPACVIVKHANPCGVARAETLLEAYRRALACDNQSAFGGIVASTGTEDTPVMVRTGPLLAPSCCEAAQRGLVAVYRGIGGHRPRARDDLGLLRQFSLVDGAAPVVALRRPRSVHPSHR